MGERRDKTENTASRAGLDAVRLLHELQVHQAELESQNEELEEARAAAEAATQLYAELYDEAPVGYLTVSKDGCIRRANPRAIALLDAAGRDVAGIQMRSLVAPSDRSAFDEYLNAIRNGGSPGDCRISLRASSEVGAPYVLVRGSHSNVRAECHLSLIDESEQRRAEEALRLREEELRQSQKMEAVGQLAGGIAHDFNNLLTAIIGYTDLILDRPGGPGADIVPDLHEIRSAAERAADLTRQILAFARKQALQPQVVTVNELLVSLSSLLRRTLGEDVALRLKLGSGLGFCEIDPNQFCQIVLNLALNSRDAMPGGGSLTIETAPAADAQLLSPDDVPAGAGITVAVTDTGSGIDPEILPRIFEPFFTTKEQGKGTGLGLSTVHGIVRQSGGGIVVESEPGKGTTVRMYFPTVDQPSGAADATTTTEGRPAPGGRPD